MDHSIAYLMEYSSDTINTKVIRSKFTHFSKEQSLEKSEHLMHNKEQQQQWAYYHELGEDIKKFDEVFLFGPTDAKAELFNILKKDHHFDKMKIEVSQSYNMTENQRHAFVKAHFLN
ncbi:hypothetical protein FRZ67_01690 [Panacibacter ginsenosidivorans]|uniref:Uncharacterized protein n=2 Tax=Panacibacter ginsenosidivorans TaxID=1813871 RepID=A0A5B8VG88_9BACT|nr:hypothetical protein FRZ67_01690 [Panacibacter ginsenosidivorans]